MGIKHSIPHPILHPNLLVLCLHLLFTGTFGGGRLNYSTFSNDQTHYGDFASFSCSLCRFEFSALPVFLNSFEYPSIVDDGALWIIVRR